jgi:hypothetical protein
MAVDNSRVSLRARLTIAALSIGAVAVVALTVMEFGPRIGKGPNSQVAGTVIPAAPGQQNPEEIRREALNKIASLPLYFEKNQGQVDPSVRYLARSGRYSLFLTDDAAEFSLIGGDMHKGPLPAGVVGRKPPETRMTESAVRVRLIGANPHPVVEGLEPLPGRVNYLIGEQKDWHRNIPTFGRVRLHDVYPGVDVVYYGSPSALEYDFVAAAGADTSKIKFAIEGPATTTQTASGDLVIQTVSGVIRIDKPRNYQENADGSRTPVDGSFKLAKDGTVVNKIPTREVELQVASYDRGKALFIDPVVDTIPYSTFYGGGASSTGPVNLEQFGPVVNNAPIPMVADSGFDVAIDSTSPPKAYITGSAYSNNLPTQSSLGTTAFQSTLQGANAAPEQNPNVFIAKFDPSKSNAASLIYATYLGAKGDTTSGDEGNGDGDLGFGIAVDGTGDAYVAGQTYSGNKNSTGPDFPGTSSCGAWGTAGTNNGKAADTNVGFVSELNPDGASLIYSCYIPGSHNATAARVALVPGCSSDCDAYVVGSTQSTVADLFPEEGGLQTNLATGEGGLSNGFMLVVGGNGAGSTPVYSTYYGGTANGSAGDAGVGISVESASEVGITGLTFSGGSGTTGRIPLSANAAQSTFLGGTNKTSMAFVAVINPSTTGSGSLTYGSYLGGSGTEDSFFGSEIAAIGDLGTAIVLDSGKIWVAGATASTNFPVDGTNGISTSTPAYQTTNEPEAEAGAPATTGFVTEIDPSQTGIAKQILYSSYFGGGGLQFTFEGFPIFATGDAIGALAEHDGVVYLTGLTSSAADGGTFPTSTNACQTTNNTSGIPFDVDGNTVPVPITAFVTKLDTTQTSAASELAFSTLLGGSGDADIGGGIQFDPTSNQIYVAGVTYSQDFPVTSNGFSVVNHAAINEGATNAFLTVLNPTGNTCPTPFTKPTPTTSATPTATATGATATATATSTKTATATATSTISGGTPTKTATATATSTKTATATATATRTATATATSTSGTPTKTATATATATSTSGTKTATATPTRTATATATATKTATPSPSPTSGTRTATATPTRTATATRTATVTPTPTASPTPGIGTLDIHPKALDFGDKTVEGKTSKAKKVTLKNVSSKKSKADVIIDGESTGLPFEIKKACAKTLDPGKSCDVEVTFTAPENTTPQTGALLIIDDATGSPQTVTLSGTGKAPKVKK